jgi:hypothetical protein
MTGLTRRKTMQSAGLSVLCAGVIAGGGALLLATGASAQDPPGNNGFIKVDDQPLDDIPNNNPHVGCVFHVDFYNYDEGVGEAEVIFEMQAPTKDVDLTVDGDTSPDIGEDPNGGGNDVDASVTYTLSFDGEPHPVQGFHVKLTIHAPGSIGADVKHKVFWVEGCQPPTTPPTTPPTETTPPTTPPTETTPPTTPPTETTPPTTPPTETTPPTNQPPTNQPPTDFPAGLGTGGGGTDDGSAPTSWWQAGLIGSGVLLTGGGALALRRRSDHQG